MSRCLHTNFQGDVNNSQKLEFGGAHDYITYTEANPSSNSTGSRAVLHKETVPYHTTSPSASLSDRPSIATNAGQPSYSSVYSDDIYKVPIGQKFRVSSYKCTPGSSLKVQSNIFLIHVGHNKLL